MIKYAVFLVILVLFAGWSLLTAIYCAWLTATPLTPERLHFVQAEFYVWIAAFGAALICSFVIIVRVIRFRRPKTTRAV